MAAYQSRSHHPAAAFQVLQYILVIYTSNDILQEYTGNDQALTGSDFSTSGRVG